MRAAWLLGIVTLVTTSCKDDTTTEPQKETGSVSVYTDTKQVEALRVDFTKALAKSLNEKNVRDFLKAEAQKQYDGDYDILYAMVKDRKLANGETFEQTLTRLSGSDQARNWSANLPLLTIFVPELSTFSSESWNTTTQIPDVAIDNSHLADKNGGKLTAFNTSLQEFTLDAKQAPTKPTLVIKENERIVSKPKFNAGSKAIETIFERKSSKVISENATHSFYFIGDVDPKERIEKQNRTTANRPVPPSLQFGYQHMSGFPNEPGSQRDWVYYRIWPKFNDIETVGPNINGGVDYDWSKGPLGNVYYTERLTKFKFSQIGGLQNATESWTEGNLEFHLLVSFVYRDGTGQTDLKVFFLNANALKDGNNNPVEVDPDIEINQWDMYRYGDEWKFTFLEHDPGGSTQTTVTSKSTFGINFETNPQWNFIVKIGIKLGLSGNFEKNRSEVINITAEDDQLGNGRVRFGDPIITDGFSTRYSVNTGALDFTIEPVIKITDSRPYPYID